MITLTDAAKVHIKQNLQSRNKIGIHLGVRKTGCSGYAYTVDYVDTPVEQAVTTVDDDITIFVNHKDTPIIGDITVDFQKKMFEQRFNFINPLEKARCGCGESFTV